MFRFDAAAGSRIFVDTFSTNGVGNGSWRLLDPYLNVVTFANERSDRGPLTLNLTGTYTLLFEGYFDDNSAQPYRFNIIPVSDAAQTLTVGTLTSGSIDVPASRSNISSASRRPQRSTSIHAPTTAPFDGTSMARPGVASTTERSIPRTAPVRAIR